MRWQVVPKQLIELIMHENPEKASRAMQAMMKMQKIIIDDLDQ
jgi:predicted 3-demethylubiquinone-9 3-methyltransferase (glyoxalase superfamily)